MRRRSHLTIALVALLMVGASIVPTPRDQAQATDPLAAAKAQKQALADALTAQRASLAALKAKADQLTATLDATRAELAAVTAEYNRVSGLLQQVRADIVDITAQLANLRAQIAELDRQLQAVAQEIRVQGEELVAREALLQEHLRAAYEHSQTSVLELLMSADSLDAATTQVGYLLTVSDQDTQLASDIRSLRADLETKKAELQSGREELAAARDQADLQAQRLAERQAELAAMDAQLAALKGAADKKRRQQEDALNAALEASGNVAKQIEASQRAFDAATKLVARLQAAAAGHRDPSAFGFRWPEDKFRVTQEWGPTTFRLEPPYTYHGIYYAHFHGGIDLGAGCGTPIRAAGPGKVVASGQPLWPWDSGYGVVISHGSGVLSWYWHLRAEVIVSPGQTVTIGQVVGYEGNTGNSTGCHLHFAVNDHGVWENPRVYLP